MLKSLLFQAAAIGAASVLFFASSTSNAFGAPVEDPAAEPVARWVQCAQSCQASGTECACIIVMGGTCHVLLTGPGSCTGSECYADRSDGSQVQCKDGVINIDPAPGN